MVPTTIRFPAVNYENIESDKRLNKKQVKPADVVRVENIPFFFSFILRAFSFISIAYWHKNSPWSSKL